MSGKPLKDDDNLVILARDPDPEDEEELDLGKGRRDDQLAHRLAQNFPEGIGDRVRFDHSISLWYIWDGVRWAPDVKRRIHVLLRQRWNRWVKSIDAKELADLGVLLDMRKQQSVLDSLSTMPPIGMVGTEFDTHPYLLGVKNGTVDLTTGKLRAGDPADLITKSTKINYRPDLAGNAAMFEEFLLQVTSSNPKMAEYLKLIFGTALFGHIQPQEFYVFWGGGGNGKGVLLNLIGRIFGDYAITPSRTMYVKTRQGEANSSAPRADLISLYGKRLSHLSEPEGQLNEMLLKEHSGNDLIHARDLHSKARNTIEFPPTFSLFFRTNKPPQIEDTGTSMVRRARVIPFRQEFVGSNRDDGIDERLWTEAEAILATLVSYAVKYHTDPASIRDLPEDVRDASDAQVKNKDPLAGFLVDRCIIESGLKATSADLFAEYNSWVTDQNDPDIVRLTRTAFGLQLMARFKPIHNSRPAAYVGVGLRTPPPDQNDE